MPVLTLLDLGRFTLASRTRDEFALVDGSYTVVS